MACVSNDGAALDFTMKLTTVGAPSPYDSDSKGK